MHLLGVCALVIALAALLIMGFCDVAQDLLSRATITAPSWPDEDQPPQLVAELAEHIIAGLTIREVAHRSVRSRPFGILR
jgi:hypothetical protein